ncbi:MAG TPA: hypothetical protein VI248_18470 [Kineosporiaceae bacterium]
MRRLQRLAFWTLEFGLHLAEYAREAREQRREAARTVRRPRSAAPREAGCYPYHTTLRPDQLVHPEDLL